MKILLWLPKAAIFFALFAFALNNQQMVSVFFFFGTQWQGPLVLVVLAAFVGGLAVGVLAMVPRWWHQRKRASKAAAIATPDSLAEPVSMLRASKSNLRTAKHPSTSHTTIDADAPDGV